MSMGFLVGVGSNIAPERNVPSMLERLVRRFGDLRISSVRRTEPQGIESGNAFLNLVIHLETDMNEGELKNWLNALEEELGRDRSNPDKKRLDRTADLDLLCRIDRGERLTREDLPPEPYLRPSLVELAVGMGVLPDDGSAATEGGASLTLDGAAFGEQPALLRLDKQGKRIRVVALEPLAAS